MCLKLKFFVGLVAIALTTTDAGAWGGDYGGGCCDGDVVDRVFHLQSEEVRTGAKLLYERLTDLDERELGFL